MQRKPAVLLMPLCLTACHQTTNRSTAKDEILTGSYIDPTKTRFPLADYSQSVDKWIPPDSADYTIPVIDSATQQRYFSALKSHYFGMDSEAHSPWNDFYITALLKKTQHRPGMPVLSSFLATAVLIGKLPDFIPLAGKRRLEGIRIRRLTISIMPPGEALWSGKFSQSAANGRPAL